MAPHFTVQIIGIDLAWGERNGDGLCLLDTDETPSHARVVEFAHTFGDAAFFDWIEERTGSAPRSLLLFDAPLICPNVAGSRPVDRLTHVRFGRYHAGAHPANATRCPRPLRLAEALSQRGFAIGWELAAHPKLMTEVFPHPAMVRMFGLSRIIKYKRGPIAERRKEFSRLQLLLRQCVREQFPSLAETPPLDTVLAADWTKPAEDQLDAFVCALVGLRHWQSQGRRSEVIGDLETGFILLPAAE